MLEKIIEDRAMAVLRIQKKDDFKTILRSRAYPSRKRESSMYRRGMRYKVGKKVGIATELVAQHLEAKHKGYFEQESKTL